MGEKRHNWTWKHRVALAVSILLSVPIVVVFGLRKPWIRPLPGVRIEMALPAIDEKDLGPDSAYRLLLRAAEVAHIPEEDRPLADFGSGLTVEKAEPLLAVQKLRYRPWPSVDPPSLEKRIATVGRTRPFFPEGPGEKDLFLRRQAADITAPWTLEQFRAMEFLADLPDESLRLIDAAMAAPMRQMPIQRTEHGPDTYLVPMRDLVWRLQLHAARAAKKGDYETAFADVSRTLAMTHLICRGSGLGSLDEARWWDSVCLRTPWTIAMAGTPPAAVLKAAAADIVEQVADAEPYAEIIRADALLNQWQLPEAYAETEAEILVIAGDPKLPVWRRKPLPFLLGFAPLAGSSIEATSVSLDCFSQHVIALAERTYSPEVCTAYDELVKPVKSPPSWPELVFRTRDPLGLLVLDQYSMRFQHYHEQEVSHRARWLVLGLLLAVRAYELDHAAPPASLGDLVPDYLPQVPLDPFDGQPLRYRTAGVPDQPPGIWTVYSIGPNFVDDGGLDSEKVRPVRYAPRGDFAWTSTPPYPPGR